MMGLRNWLHWLTWFLHHFIMMLISSVIIVVLLKVPTPFGPVMPYVDGTLLFVCLLLYITTTIFFCFMIACFFSKGNKHVRLLDTTILRNRLFFFNANMVKQSNMETLQVPCFTKLILLISVSISNMFF